MDSNIRPAVEEDLPQILSLISITIDLDPTYDSHSRAYMKQQVTRNRLLSSLSTGYNVVYEENNRVIGFGGTSGNLITYLYVDPIEQGRGIGKQLLLWLENHILNTHRFVGKNKLSIVLSTPHASAFYAKNGYSEVTRYNYPTTGGSRMLNIRMKKTM